VAVDLAVGTALACGATWAVTTLPHDHTVVVTMVAALLCTSAVAYRRIAPASAAVVSLTAVAAYQISGHDNQGGFVSLAIVLVGYLVGRRRPPTVVASVALYGLAAVTVVDIDTGFSAPEVLLTWGPLVAAPIGCGVLVARRESLLRQLGDTRARLTDEHALSRAWAVASERTRLARELHDVVAHSVSVMVIQAGAARLLIQSDRAASRESMRTVSTCGRQALEELGTVLGAGTDADQGVAAAVLGLAHLPQLAERAHEAGLSVRLHVDVDVELSADLGIAALRIVQEALTNVVKHSAATTTDVRVMQVDGAIDILVTDGGPGRPAEVDGTGNGLIGMRERVALYGGDFAAGPTGSGGFGVHARLPLGAPHGPAASGSRVEERESHGGPVQLPRRDLRWFDLFASVAWLIALAIDVVTSRHRGWPVGVDLAVVAVMALAGLGRRRVPFLFVLVVGAGALALSGGIAAPQRASVVGFYTVIVGAYSVAAFSGRSRAIAGLGTLLGGVVAVTAVQHQPAGVAAGGALLTAAVWIAGRVIREQRELVANLRAANARLVADREQRTLVAVADERLRIAAELQSIVGRLIAVMVSRSDAIGEMLAGPVDVSADALIEIEQSGREALTQLRLTLGVLRSRPQQSVRGRGLGDVPVPTDARVALR
jgi:signal transduction histidine kinase